MLVGEPARRRAAANPEGTATAFKRQMGRRVTVRLRDREVTPEQLSAFLLRKLKRDAEAFLGEPVTKAVVTVPAYFDDNQRSATKDACGIAGIEVARLVNEPTAASLAYGLDRAGEELRIAVIDLGGGTLDVTILEFGRGVFEVKATSGDTHLGGTNMDERVFDHLAYGFRADTGIDVRADLKPAARLREAAELAKVELSTSVTAHVSLPYLGAVAGEPRHLELDLGRAELEHLVRPVIERCQAPVEQALQDAGVTPAQIDRVVFVGGPTRMPTMRAFFEDVFGRTAEMGVDPMECVASGAAIQAGVLTGEVGEIVLVDVTPLTLGVETLGGIATPLIARNTPVPVRKTESFTTAADLQTSVTIHVLQGERPMAADNTSLGRLNLDGIPPAPRGCHRLHPAPRGRQAAHDPGRRALRRRGPGPPGGGRGAQRRRRPLLPGRTDPRRPRRQARRRPAGPHRGGAVRHQGGRERPGRGPGFPARRGAQDRPAGGRLDTVRPGRWYASHRRARPHLRRRASRTRARRWRRLPLTGSSRWRPWPSATTTRSSVSPATPMTRPSRTPSGAWR